MSESSIGQVLGAGSFGQLSSLLRRGPRGATSLTVGPHPVDLRADRLMPEISRVEIDQQGGCRRGTMARCKELAKVGRFIGEALETSKIPW